MPLPVSLLPATATAEVFLTYVALPLGADLLLIKTTNLLTEEERKHFITVI